MSTDPDLIHEDRRTPGDDSTAAVDASSRSQPGSDAATRDWARAPRWLVDRERSIVEFRVRHFWGLVTVTGRFQRFEGRDEGNAIELTVDADSLDTGNERRDAHLRSADFFDVENHPQLSFRSTGVTDQADGTMRVVGELDVAGRTVQLAFEAVVRVVDDELEIEAETSVAQRIFGMTWSPLGMVRSPATLHVRARLVPEERTR